MRLDSYNKQVGELVLQWGDWDRKSLEAILPLVYDELRRLAHNHLRKQRRNHTLQTTALVHEAYLRLAGEKSQGVDSPATAKRSWASARAWLLREMSRGEVRA